jgi:hypothetical protein
VLSVMVVERADDASFEFCHHVNQRCYEVVINGALNHLSVVWLFHHSSTHVCHITGFATGASIEDILEAAELDAGAGMMTPDDDVIGQHATAPAAVLAAEAASAETRTGRSLGAAVCTLDDATRGLPP